jgi:histidine triad (HIT) family protein
MHGHKHHSWENEMASDDCIFCKIINGEIEAEKLYEDDLTVVIRDINPQAPTHLLLLPKAHFSDPSGITERMEPSTGHLLGVAAKMAAREGIAESGYRLVVNVGPDGGQVVGHFHMHLMGGKKLGGMG